MFKLSKRHYDLMVKQAQTNFPQECGGFLGGVQGIILAILPTFNQHLYNKTDTYGLGTEDFIRAKEFFKKHNVTYFGVYHTHPKGVAYPSQGDINTGQRFHFILSLQTINTPVLRAFEIINNTVIPREIDIMSDEQLKAASRKTPTPTTSPAEALPPTIRYSRDPIAESDLLSEYIHNIRNETPQYPRQNPIRLGSDFSTLA